MKTPNDPQGVEQPDPEKNRAKDRPENVDDPSLVLLPSAGENGDEPFSFHCWKVADGSSVRVGDTVALARRGTADSGDGKDATAAPSAPPAAHKRPTKRRKRTPAAAAPPTKPETSASQPAASSTTAKTTATKAPTLPPASSSSASSIKTKASAASDSNLLPILARKSGILKYVDSRNDSKLLATIQDCTHPTVVEGLCVVCGEQPPKDSRKGTLTSSTIPSSSADSFSSSTAKRHQQAIVTVSGQSIYMTEEEQHNMARTNRQRLVQQRRLGLVLDLDHTLVHAVNESKQPLPPGQPQRRVLEEERADVHRIVLPLDEDAVQDDEEALLRRRLEWRQQQQQEHVTPLQWAQRHRQQLIDIKMRPHVAEMMQQLLPLYEMTIYTAGTRHYAQQVLHVLAKHMLIVQSEEAETTNKEAAHPSNDVDSDAMQKKGSEKDAGVKDQEVKENGLKPTVSFEDSPENETTKKKGVSFELPSASYSEEKKAAKQAKHEQWKSLEQPANELRQRVFASRVVSRTDVRDLGSNVKSLNRVFGTSDGGNMAAILDDREDVWTNVHNNTPTNGGAVSSRRKGEPPDNLLLVRPYHWAAFVGMADVNNASGVDLAASSNGNGNGRKEQAQLKQAGSNEKVEDVEDALLAAETDEQLLWTTDILKRVHKRFYDEQQQQKSSSNQMSPIVSRTVPEIIREMRLEVLAGCKIVLSGLVPLHKQQQTDPSRPRHPIIRYAQDLGATLSSAVTDDVTHVVAAKDGTDKTLDARKVPGCVIVKASWLMECWWSIERRDVAEHLLVPRSQMAKASSRRRREEGNGSSKPKAPPPPVATATRDVASSSSDEDDEDFLGLESEMMGE